MNRGRAKSIRKHCLIWCIENIGEDFSSNFFDALYSQAKKQREFSITPDMVKRAKWASGEVHINE